MLRKKKRVFFKLKSIKNQTFIKNNVGFTLIEIAIVVLISSMIMAGMISLYKVYVEKEVLLETRQKQALIEAAISTYQGRNNGILPCPSDASLPTSDPSSGFEDCSLTGSPPGTCSPGGGICIVAGERDTDNDGILDPVLIGGIPYRELQIRMSDSDGDGSLDMLSSGGVIDDINFDLVLDPWGYQMTYAVSSYMTNLATNESTNGVINIQTELGVDISNPPGSAHFVIVAHGNNHAGAYTVGGATTGGIIAIPCDAATAEGENCDRDDAVFVRGLRTFVTGATYYDDTVRDRSFAITRLWEFADTTDIFNLNIGNVGVGTTTPSRRLEVIGNLRAEEIWQNELCDTGGANCWDPDNLASSVGTNCSGVPALGNIFVVKGIKSGEVDCIEVPMVQILTTQTCAVAGTYVSGFDGFGNIICETP